jgi:hypothetical protein
MIIKEDQLYKKHYYGKSKTNAQKNKIHRL